MRSTKGVAASLAIFLMLPAAIVAGSMGGDPAGEAVVHLFVGTGFVLLAGAMFDFGLARWITALGAAAAFIFGGTFLLQFVSNVTHNAFITQIAFDVLGHQLERVLPDVVFVWFLALLLAGSQGRTRLVGWAVMPIVVGLEVAIVAGAALGIEVPFIKAIYLILPFVWLVLESAKPSRRNRTFATPRRAEVADAASA